MSSDKSGKHSSDKEKELIDLINRVRLRSPSPPPVVAPPAHVHPLVVAPRPEVKKRQRSSSSSVPSSVSAKSPSSEPEEKQLVALSKQREAALIKALKTKAPKVKREPVKRVKRERMQGLDPSHEMTRRSQVPKVKDEVMVPEPVVVDKGKRKASSPKPEKVAPKKDKAPAKKNKADVAKKDKGQSSRKPKKSSSSSDGLAPEKGAHLVDLDLEEQLQAEVLKMSQLMDTINKVRKELEQYRANPNYKPENYNPKMNKGKAKAANKSSGEVLEDNLMSLIYKLKANKPYESVIRELEEIADELKQRQLKIINELAVRQGFEPSTLHDIELNIKQMLNKEDDMS